MAPERAYESPLPWNPTRPDTIVICCVDGRWRRHIMEFAANYLHAELLTDIMAVPGGVEPLTLMDLVPKDFNFFRRRLEALVAAHGTKRIVAIAHQDCAWYKARKIGPIRIDLRAIQLADLKRAAAGIRKTFPSMTVETYFARLEGENPARVVFDAV
jgi:hypothetical protein